MQTLAGIAGGTLGYIIGNLPGGYIGYKLGKKMAPVTRSKKRKVMMTPAKSYSSRSSVRSSVTSRRGSIRSAGSVRDSVVTRQHDYGNQYRFKKMPKYKRRRWARFMKKVAAVQLKQAGLRTVVFNSRGTLTSDPGYQQIAVLGLYGVGGSIDRSDVYGFNDLYRIFKNDPDIVQTGAAPGNVPKSGKLQFGSGVIDFTVRNLSSDIEAEVDVYFGWFRKDAEQIGNKIDWNPLTDYKNAATDTIGSASAINIFERGATLFDKPSGLSDTGYHIHKKLKMILAPGQSSFLQHRDPKNHMIDWVHSGDLGYAKKGLTFGIWVVFKPSVTATTEAVVTLGFGVTRKYSYAKVEDNVDRVSYNPIN